MTGSARIVRANARNLPLADNTVDLVCHEPAVLRFEELPGRW
jgi:ubiquinone/menaquinone biosynthesis C-methylase UbiE